MTLKFIVIITGKSKARKTGKEKKRRRLARALLANESSSVNVAVTLASKPTEMKQSGQTFCSKIKFTKLKKR